MAPRFYVLFLNRHDHPDENDDLASFKWFKELLVETLWRILLVAALGGTTDSPFNWGRLLAPT